MRQFRGHTDRITDLQISQDARWLLSSSLDGTIRVWDVPSARCLQVSLAGGGSCPASNLILPAFMQVDLCSCSGVRFAVHAVAWLMINTFSAKCVPCEGVEAGGACDSAEPEPCTGHAGNHPRESPGDLPVVQHNNLWQRRRHPALRAAH